MLHGSIDCRSGVPPLTSRHMDPRGQETPTLPASGTQAQVPAAESGKNLVEPASRTHALGSARDSGEHGIFAAGARIGPYEVLRLLGRGSMGTVVAARHVELGREVALKVLSAALAGDADSVERFKRESEATARLDHPSIVRLFERGETDGVHYFAMELVKGTSLEALIRRERVPYVEAARIMAQCAHAVDVAHGSGILHRDLKPANILVDGSGRARITDFGLARIDRKATLTTEGTVVGTPLYIAPEIATGERATRRSDIYSLGATLYELATGKPPYPGRDARTVMMRVLNEAPTPPAEADPRIPRDLVRIVGKAMARNPDERYPNARAMALDLERFAQGRALEIAGSTAAFRESSSARVAKRTALHAAIVVSVLAVISALLYLNNERRKAEARAQKDENEIRRLKQGIGTEAPPDTRIDEKGLQLARDRDVRARYRLRDVAQDAHDDRSRRSFDDILARARQSEKDDPSLAAALLRQALQLFPHRWDVHLELARTIESAEPDEAEIEYTMCVLVPEAERDDQILARAERGRFYRTKGDPLSCWLAVPDLRNALQARLPGLEARRVQLSADVSFVLAILGDLKGAESTLEDTGGASGDDLARASLARAAIARQKGDASGVEAELGRARDAATTDETRHLVEVFGK